MRELPFELFPASVVRLRKPFAVRKELSVPLLRIKSNSAVQVSFLIIKKKFPTNVDLNIDIAFVRTWYRVDVPEFYTPVTSLLLPTDAKNTWSGMRTLGQIKRERNIHNEVIIHFKF